MTCKSLLFLEHRVRDCHNLRKVSLMILSFMTMLFLFRLNDFLTPLKTNEIVIDVDKGGEMVSCTLLL